LKTGWPKRDEGFDGYIPCCLPKSVQGEGISGLDRLMVRIALISLSLFLLMNGAVIAKSDPDTGRIRLLLIGDHWYGEGVYLQSLLRSDPRIDLLASIETSNGLLPEEVRRRSRLDFPRTRQRLASSVDVLEFSYAPPWCLTGEQQRWVHDSVTEDGLGLILIHMGWRHCLADPILRCNRAEDWVNSVIYRAFPMDIVLGRTIKPSSFMDVVGDSPLVDLPGFERQAFGPAGPTTYIGLVHARPGSVVYASWRSGDEDAIISSQYGGGTTLAIPVSGTSLGDAMRTWKYFIDFVLNRVYVAAAVVVPEDPELSHTLRAAFAQFEEQRNLVLNVIDFVDRFGANTIELSRMVDDLDDTAREANRLYVSGDYQGSLDRIREAGEGLLDLSRESTEVRRRALLWVYATEWLTVSATAMASGWLIWTVMVQRRYFREVGTTRPRSRR